MSTVKRLSYLAGRWEYSILFIFDDEYQSIQSCIEKINPLFLESWKKRKNGPLLKIESASRLLTQKAAR